MELKITELSVPGKITFNYEELKAELIAKADMYASVVYDEEQIKQAKADKAALNKLKTAINDERIRREREYMAPFMDFKTKVEEIKAIIDKPIAEIDKQIKEFEKKEQAEQREKIDELFDRIANRPEWLRIEQIWDPRWLNKSTTFRQIEENMRGWCGRIETELATIASLGDGAFEAAEEYKRSLDLGKAVAEGKRQAEIQRAKRDAALTAAEEEITKAEQAGLPWDEPIETPDYIKNAEQEPDTEEPQWIQFEALLTVEKAEALATFCRVRGIELRAL